jgi:hypothetical protein
VPIATVRLAGGGTAVARLEAADGDSQVELAVVRGAPVARPADGPGV